MTTILLIIHLMVAITLVALVLLQRSEGGALGIGGGGGGMMSGRGAGNMLTRATAIVGAIFFATGHTGCSCDTACTCRSGGPRRADSSARPVIWLHEIIRKV